MSESLSVHPLFGSAAAASDVNYCEKITIPVKDFVVFEEIPGDI